MEDVTVSGKVRMGKSRGSRHFQRSLRVLWGAGGAAFRVPGEGTKSAYSKRGTGELGARDLRSSLKPWASLCPAEKRPKTELSTALSGCGGGDGGGGDDNGSESLEEKDVIHVELQGSELWKRFHDIGTEMIITKAGRFGSAQVVHKGCTPFSLTCAAFVRCGITF